MNLQGKEIKPEISKQIDIRQKIYGSINRTNKQLVYLNSRTSFVRVVSSVDIDPSKFKTQSKELNDVIKEYSSSELAKNFILFNGVSTINNTSKSGIARDKSILNSRVYGFGGLEFGLTPMPGIESFSLNSPTMDSVKTSTITIKAWNRVQFEIIDLLYLRLGYSVLVEWGNVIYFDNNNKFQSQPQFSLQKDFLNNSVSYEELLKKMEKYRLESGGNYDAFLGKVSNFSWNFDDAGAYNITLTLISLGDITESFKVNTPSSIVISDEKKETQNNTSQPGEDIEESISVESEKNKHQFGMLFYKFKRATLNQQPSSANGCVVFGDIRNNQTQESLLNTNDILSKKNFLIQVYDGNPEPQYYIRLGALLAYIQNVIFPQYVKNESKKPIINIDYNDGDNFMYTIPNQISADPRICLVKQEIPTTSGGAYSYIREAEDFSVEIGGVRVGKIMNIYVNCLFVLQVINSNIGPDLKCTLDIFLREILNGINNALGNINGLQIFIEEVSNTLKIIDTSQIPDKNKLFNALGLANPTPTVIDMYGYYNREGTITSTFVKNFSFQTEITPDLAMSILIGSSQSGFVKGSDSTSLSNLNTGLIDRIKPDIKDTDSTSTISSPDLSQEALKEIENKYGEKVKQYKAYILEIGSKLNQTKPKWNPDNIDVYTSLQSDFFEYLNAVDAIKNKKGSNSLKYIPISFNLTLDGISGLSAREIIRIDTSFLPSNYPEIMDFYIESITHNVSNEWTVELKTIMVIKDPSKNPGVGYGTSNNTISNRASSRGNSQVSNNACLANDIRLSPNYKLSQLSCNASVAKYNLPNDIKTGHSRGSFTRNQIIDNLRNLALNILEPIKSKYPTVVVTNAYRNKGSNSQHEIGEAADIQFTDIVGTIKEQNKKILLRAQDIKSILDNTNGYDQFLLEYKTDRGNRPWIHISYRGDGKNRKDFNTFLNDKIAINGSKNLYNPLA
jgi:hypothetical protein